jgi:hypothetical protein
MKYEPVIVNEATPKLGLRERGLSRDIALSEDISDNDDGDDDEEEEDQEPRRVMCCGPDAVTEWTSMIRRVVRATLAPIRFAVDWNDPRPEEQKGSHAD